MNPNQLAIMILPVAILQLAFQAYCVYDLVRRQRTRNLNFAAWLVIIILGEFLGAAAYLIFGRAED